MTTTYQVSDKAGDLIVLIKSEHDEPGAAFGDFAAALSLIGNRQAESVLSRIEDALEKATPTVSTGFAAATAAVTQSFPQARPLPAAAQAPAPAADPGDARVCQHGTNTIVNGTSKKDGKPWRAWGCPARKDDPTGCGLTFIRG